MTMQTATVNGIDITFEDTGGSGLQPGRSTERWGVGLASDDGRAA